MIKTEINKKETSWKETMGRGVCSGTETRTKPSELVLNLSQSTRAMNHPDRSSAVHKLGAYSSAA